MHIDRVSVSACPVDRLLLSITLEQKTLSLLFFDCVMRIWCPPLRVLHLDDIYSHERSSLYGIHHKGEAHLYVAVQAHLTIGCCVAEMAKTRVQTLQSPQQ